MTADQQDTGLEDLGNANRGTTRPNNLEATTTGNEDRDTIRLSDLEVIGASPDRPELFENQVTLNTDKGIVVYIGKVSAFFSGFDISGSVSLKRYARTLVSDKNKPRAVCYDSVDDFPLVQPQSESRDFPVWEIRSSGDYPAFLLDGQIPSDSKSDNFYRKFLITAGQKISVFLSSRVLDLVFNPIDEKIREMYKQVEKFREGAK